ADRPGHLDDLVESLGDLAVDADQIFTQLDREVAALERAQRSEDLAMVEPLRGRRALAVGVGSAGTGARSVRPRSITSCLARLGWLERVHASSVPYSARRILSALAGLTMWASNPASNAATRSLAWPYPVIAIRRGL